MLDEAAMAGNICQTLCHGLHGLRRVRVLCFRRPTLGRVVQAQTCRKPC